MNIAMLLPTCFGCFTSKASAHAIGVLRVRSAIDGITFTECANHLAALVSELLDQQSARKLSSTNSERPKYNKGSKGTGKAFNKNNGKGRKGLHMPDGTVWTRHLRASP
jgi:hypothetical protein